jgi:uncharacterized membrane protein
MVATFSVTFFVLCKLRHDRYQTYAFDLGTYDQSVWLLSRFRAFNTVRGLNVFGHHMNLILVVLAPFYRLGGGPMLLLLVQVVAQAFGGVAIYLLARDRLADRWLALVLAAALLLNPTYQFLTWEFFHPDALAVAPLLFAYWAARAHRWRWFVVAAVLAVACKEDVALAVAALGIAIALHGTRKIGVVIATIAGAWYLVTTRVLMPVALGGLSPFYYSYFGDLGSSFPQVLWNALVRPGKVLDLATRPDRVSYYRMMFVPMALIPAASLRTLLVAGPMLAVNALTTFPYARDYRFHYSALVVAGGMLATVEGIARLGRTARVREFLVGLVAATTLASTVAWGPSPISVKFRTGYWPLWHDARVETMREAIALLPSDAAVSAIFFLVPHLTHRPEIYNFPEPWKAVTWGVNGEHLRDPGRVQWLLIDRRQFGEYDRRLVDLLLEREFVPRLDKDDILVAQRVVPGGPLVVG